MTVASTVIGVAGFPTGPARWIALAVGTTMFATGLGFAVLALVRDKPDDR